MPAFTVVFADGETKTFPEGVHFQIETSAVLTITEGDDVRQVAPHGWLEVRSRREEERAYFG
jgi:hypothetical protein